MCAIDTRNPLRVLLVDDNTDAIDALRWLLQTLGHQVACATHAAQALAALPQFEPGVAVVDLRLPDMDGCELAAAIRERCGVEGRPAPRLVALSGLDGEDERRRTAAAGFARHLTKPVQVDLLIDALHG